MKVATSITSMKMEPLSRLVVKTLIFSVTTPEKRFKDMVPVEDVTWKTPLGKGKAAPQAGRARIKLIKYM